MLKYVCVLVLAAAWFAEASTVCEDEYSQRNAVNICNPSLFSLRLSHKKLALTTPAKEGICYAIDPRRNCNVTIHGGRGQKILVHSGPKFKLQDCTAATGSCDERCSHFRIGERCYSSSYPNVKLDFIEQPSVTIGFISKKFSAEKAHAILHIRAIGCDLDDLVTGSNIHIKFFDEFSETNESYTVAVSCSVQGHVLSNQSRPAMNMTCRLTDDGRYVWEVEDKLWCGVPMWSIILLCVISLLVIIVLILLIVLCRYKKLCCQSDQPNGSKTYKDYPVGRSVQEQNSESQPMNSQIDNLSRPPVRRMKVCYNANDEHYKTPTSSMVVGTNGVRGPTIEFTENELYVGPDTIH